jgi:AcrR family transcriptional regulator
MSKRELIIETALNLFVENGFHGTATSKIAQQSNVANGTLFNLFKTKDELVIAIYITLKDELAEYITKNSENNTQTKDIIKAQISASLFWGLDNNIKFRYIQQFQNSPYIKLLNQNIINEQINKHLQLIQKGIDEKLIKPLPIDFIFSLISSQTFGLYQYMISKELSKKEQNETIQMTFEMLWDMIT